jgi:flagellar basal body-associated protein FliL
MVICLCIVLFAGSLFVMSQRLEIRNQKLEFGSQNLEVRSQSLPAVSLAGSEAGDQKSEVGDQGFCEERFEYFNDFIVQLKDDRKKDRVLICDVVIELNRGMKLPQERIELRKIIYNTLKEPLKIPPPASQARALRARGDFHPSDLYEIRKSLKEKINISLNNFMGDEIIKKVYFTKFLLL